MSIGATALGAGAPRRQTVSVDVVAVLAGRLTSARRGGVPVLLPQRYVADAPHVYGSGGAAPGGYQLSLADAPGCDYATACFLAAFSGIRGGTPIAGTRVTLVGGIAGRYRATACGASCSPGEVSWVRGGVRYEVQAAVIGPERATLVAMANSAISAGPR